MENRKVKVHEIAVILKISSGSTYTILHEHLAMKRLFTKWVPCLLITEQKKSGKTMAKLNELIFKLLPHPPYSPD